MAKTAAALKAAPRPVTDMTPRQLAEELIDLHCANAATFDRADAIKSALKSGAEANFKEVFAGKGEVSVSAPKPAEITGSAPELIVAGYQDLSAKDQKALIKQGLVQIVDVEKAAYYGAVRVKVF